jgi:hypothetical protein
MSAAFWNSAVYRLKIIMLLAEAMMISRYRYRAMTIVA